MEVFAAVRPVCSPGEALRFPRGEPSTESKASSSSTMADIGFPAFRQNKDTRSCQNLVIGCGNIIQRTSISATNVAARQHHAFAVIVSAGPFWSLKIVQLAQALNWRTVLGEIS